MTNKWLKLFPDAERTKADFQLDGEAAYAAMLKAIDTADSDGHYIYILGWMLDINVQLTANEPDSSLYKHLADAAARGVEIRILIWDNPIPDYAKMANDVIPRLNKLPKTKVFIDEYTYFPPQSKALLQKIAPYLTKFISYISAQFRPEVLQNADLPFMYMIYRLLGVINLQTIGAHHEKVTIVKGKDGLIAFCGGIDYNKNRVITTLAKKDYRFPYLHDTACRLQGPAAHEVLQKFTLRWKNHPVASREALLGANETKPKPSPAPYPYCKVVGTYNSVDGKQKIRTLKKAYFDIVDAAEKYIYIEDQYLVNVEVAQHINARLKLSSFERAIFVIQDSEETSDIFIPNRKRGEFFKALTDGLSESDRQKKILLALFDKRYWKQSPRYHPAMHAKTLIVDDEIAIIGSANVNQRSFTNDSETSVVVFDDNPKADVKFARAFRHKTWEEYVHTPVRGTGYDSWVTFSDAINQGTTNFEITKYVKDSQDDLDFRIQQAIGQSSVIGVVVASELLDHDLTKTSVALSPWTVTFVFDTIWENLIDPNADSAANTTSP
jgi:phosphatidylserine/phosphatidylglycerophosphate/cardiolipin synthase-like enzyme